MHCMCKMVQEDDARGESGNGEIFHGHSTEIVFGEHLHVRYSAFQVDGNLKRKRALNRLCYRGRHFIVCIES